MSSIQHTHAPHCVNGKIDKQNSARQSIPPKLKPALQFLTKIKIKKKMQFLTLGEMVAFPPPRLPFRQTQPNFNLKFIPKSIRNMSSGFNDSHKPVLEVKEKLQKDFSSLPVGKNGRDDEDMILRFLKDRSFSVDEAVSKLSKAVKWRQEFGVSQLSEESIKDVAGTGKSHLHDFLDVYGRPVLMVDASKHFPGVYDPSEDEKLCVFLIEKALSRLPEGKEQILVILDLRRFGTRNADLKFTSFLFNVFYYYYPRRLGEVLLVDAPFVFRPIWQLLKPVLKSYASLVKFCSADTVRKEYFTEETVPANFRI